MNLLLLLVLAQDFEGTWKVPDAQSLAPKKCDSGDQTECLKLAWSAEAGLRSPGEDDVKRLEKAKRFHEKACALAKRSPCEHADRLTAKLEAAKTAKPAFWCLDALDGAARFVPGSRTAPTLVRGACGKVLPGAFKRGLDATSVVPPDMRAELVLQAALEGVCPGLKKKPAECKAKNASKLGADGRKALGVLLQASFDQDGAVELTGKADAMADWLLK